jgi:uncharacterized protein YybS (DUF2232 family)
MSLIEIHGRFGNTVLYYTIVMALWGFWRYVRKQGVDSSYWGALVIAEILFLVQAGFGAYLWLSGAGNLSGHGIHILYGAVSVLVIPGIFLYTHGEEHRRTALVYGVSFLFLVGIVLRAIFTAP